MSNILFHVHFYRRRYYRLFFGQLWTWTRHRTPTMAYKKKGKKKKRTVCPPIHLVCTIKYKKMCAWDEPIFPSGFVGIKRGILWGQELLLSVQVSYGYCQVSYYYQLLFPLPLSESTSLQSSISHSLPE